ncbi:MAG: FAD-dependent oxidoreductase [Woeseiaceae bacterium]|nr:FAD-dependent oxidoreductase [Woeseiaceae bacterium]NIP19819.1 FAD-dependent oxidoreductase [Woeseiaceae bacterium]NIS89936.1 FAD-dependent oxidoreductase [Woeseiaceae bacterium]
MSQDKLDCVVVGAGVIGLAIARALALAGREVVVLEAEPNIGTHTSSRNSEVIHAGLYYPEDSLKARLCVRGKALLYAYCEEHDVACERIGKLIVARDERDRDQLDAIAGQAGRNGVVDLRMLSRSEAAALEPNVVCQSALLSPSTGIIDSHGLMLAMQGEFEASGGTVVLNSRVEDLRHGDDGLQFRCADAQFACRTLVNAAGLWAQDLAAGIAGADAGWLPERRLAKGHYYAYQGKSPFRHLVYPLPDKGGLGIHATNDLSGAARFGPDVEWVDTVDYAFDDSRKPKFVEAIRRYFPALEEDKLVPAYTGIRPKLVDAGEPPGDFLVQSASDHGIPGLINLFGIESPGLTAAFAISEYVASLAD